MKDYIRLAPPLCIPSKIFFRFSARRMQELRNVQTFLSVRPPPNFGTITSVIMHLIRYVCHSPIAHAGYLCDALMALQFGPLSERFGFFFLHGLDLSTRTLEEITEADEAECLVAMSRDKIRPIGITYPAMENSEPTSEFPIGHAPTWKELVIAVEREPESILKDWVWDPEWASDSNASSLFIKFTQQIWVTVHKDQLIVGRTTARPLPTTLEDAMSVWTRHSLQGILISCHFITCNSGLEGRFTGKHHPSFSDLSKTFFPESSDDINANGAWYQFLQLGYLKDYYAILQDLSDDDAKALQDELQSIFSHLQCLPKVSSILAKSSAKLWTRSKNGMEIITNPIFYKIEQIGKATRAPSTRTGKTKSTKASIERALAQMTGNALVLDAAVEGRKARQALKARRKRMSTARLSKRKPPVCKANPAATPKSKPNRRHIHHTDTDSSSHHTSKSRSTSQPKPHIPTPEVPTPSFWATTDHNPAHSLKLSRTISPLQLTSISPVEDSGDIEGDEVDIEYTKDDDDYQYANDDGTVGEENDQYADDEGTEGEDDGTDGWMLDGNGMDEDEEELSSDPEGEGGMRRI